MSFEHLLNGTSLASGDEFTMVLDAKALDPNRGQEEVMSPRVQLEILQLLVKIQRLEGWEIWVLFNGDELKQVSHGGDFMGLRVFFSPTPPQRAPTLLECVKVLTKKDRHVVMVTQDENVEDRAMKLGALSLKGETFKKGYEDLFAVRRRPQSRLMRRRTIEMEKEHFERHQDSAIRNMIDLVD